MLTSRKPKNIKYHNQRLILALLRSTAWKKDKIVK